MIAGLRGVVEQIESDALLVNVGGVVFRVFTASSTLSGLSGSGGPVRLHTHLHVKDDAMLLYGFGTRQELRMFQLLVSVTGVGPRSALALLSSMSIDELVLAIASEETGRLSAAPGVGKRIAGRISLELKSKVGQIEGVEALSGNTASVGELMAALTALGYSGPEAGAAIRSVPNLSSMNLEDGLREALRVLSARQ